MESISSTPSSRLTAADEFLLLDLREKPNCAAALNLDFDEVYQLAADMGGMGFIHSAECEIMRNSALINIHMTARGGESRDQALLLLILGLRYRDMKPGEPEMPEPARIRRFPTTSTAGRSFTPSAWRWPMGGDTGMVVRIARFQNCYGPEGTWRGGREKAPAAISRKVAEVEGRRNDRDLGRRQRGPVLYLRRRHG